jgi:hypothetical protein
MEELVQKGVCVRKCKKIMLLGETETKRNLIILLPNFELVQNMPANRKVPCSIPGKVITFLS